MTAFELKAAKEELAALKDEASKIVAKAKAEKRVLDSSESSRFEAIKADITRIQNEIENSQYLAGVNDLIGRDSQPGQQQVDNAHVSIVDRLQIPVESRYRHGPLKSFSGPKAEASAYLMGRWFLAAVLNHKPSQAWCQNNGVQILNAQSGSDNNLGGYLIPIELESTIIDLRTKYGVIRNAAKIVPMSSDTKNAPVRKSGLTAYWGAVDSSGITASDKAWGNVQLVAKDLYTLTRVSNNLNDDAVISIGDDIAGEIAQAFAYSEDNAAFNGDGTSTYGGINGILGAVAAGAVSTASVNSWSSMVFGDFEAALGKLAHYPGIQPAWYVSKAFYHAVMLRLMDAAGGNTIATLAAGPSGQNFLGLPVIFTQVLPTSTATNTKFGVLGDLSMGTVLGNRRGMSVAVSEHAYFTNDQIAIRGHERVDFVCHDVGTASVAGSVVVLKTTS